MGGIEYVKKYLQEELEGYIENCGEDDEVCVAPCRKALEEIIKLESSLNDISAMLSKEIKKAP